ncbi:hypothetical protein ACFL56_00915, partial [Candidatus Margulisiibacteriota bacterium]
MKRSIPTATFYPSLEESFLYNKNNDNQTTEIAKALVMPGVSEIAWKWEGNFRDQFHISNIISTLQNT